MITQIYTIEDVRTFFECLYCESLSVHPDDDFNDYVNCDTNKPSYSLEDAALRNELMTSSFDICEKANVDIYDLLLQVYSK